MSRWDQTLLGYHCYTCIKKLSSLTGHLFSGSTDLDLTFLASHLLQLIADMFSKNNRMSLNCEQGLLDPRAILFMLSRLLIVQVPLSDTLQT